MLLTRGTARGQIVAIGPDWSWVIVPCTTYPRQKLPSPMLLRRGPETEGYPDRRGGSPLFEPVGVEAHSPARDGTPLAQHARVFYAQARPCVGPGLLTPPGGPKPNG